MEAGTIGVTGPVKAVFTMSALASPLTTTRICLAAMMLPMPIVMALRGTSSAEAKKREFLQPEIREKEETPEEKPIFSFETKESACRFPEYKSAEEAAKVLLDMLKGETETC